MTQLIVFVAIAVSLQQTTSAESQLQACSEANDDCVAPAPNVGPEGRTLIQMKGTSTVDSSELAALTEEQSLQQHASVAWGGAIKYEFVGAGVRCRGGDLLTPGKWDNFGKGLTTWKCEQKCNKLAECKAYSLKEKNGACTGFKSCKNPAKGFQGWKTWKKEAGVVMPLPTAPPRRCQSWCADAPDSWIKKCAWKSPAACVDCGECAEEPFFAPRLPKPETNEFPEAMNMQWKDWQCQKICQSRSELVEGAGRGCCEWTADGDCNWYPNGKVGGKGDGITWLCYPGLAGIGNCKSRSTKKTCKGASKENAVQYFEGIASFLLGEKKKPLVLDWSDEFEHCPLGKPDPSIWAFEEEQRDARLQWYTDKNAECVDGSLVITARKETPMDVGVLPWKSRPTTDTGRAYASQFKYTSSSLTSIGKKHFTIGGRGKVELRAKVDVRMGGFPAWWSMGESSDFNPPCEWPGCGEIDMLEYAAGTGWMKTNFCHARGGNEACTFEDWCQCKWHSGIKAVNKTWSKDFHTWVMEWDEDKDIIEVTVDGALIAGQTFSEADPENTGRPENPFRGKRNYMILNLAIGFVGGDPTPTEFPMKFEIDYVRVYKSM